MSDDNVVQLAGKLATVKRADKIASAIVAADGRKPWYPLDRAAMLALPDPVPLVQGWLQLDSVNWLGGPPQSGKSFVALDMAASIAAGIPWQGCAVFPAPVLYVVAESPAGFKKRIIAWEMLHNREMTGVTFVNGAPQLTSAEDVDALARCGHDQHVALVVIDTQARCTVGVDENSAKEMSTVIESLDKIRMATGAAVLSVHHTPRGAVNLRGTIAQEGAATTIIMAEKDGLNVTVSAQQRRGGKQKDVEAQPDLTLTLSPYGQSVALTKGATGLNGSARAVLSILVRHKVRISKTELLNRAKAEGVSESSVHRAAAALVEQFLAEVIREGQRTSYAVTELGIAAGQEG